MCLGHIQQAFQAVKTDWPAHDLWERLKKRYTLQNTASKWGTITSIDELTYARCEKMAEYRSKYYALKASIKEQNITIESALTIQMLNNLRPAFKTHLTIFKDEIQKDEKLEEDEALFKTIEEEETRIVTRQKARANFTITPYSRSQEGGKEDQVEWPLCKKCTYKHPQIGHARMQTMSVTDVIGEATSLNFTICTSHLTKDPDSVVNRSTRLAEPLRVVSGQSSEGSLSGFITVIVTAT